MGRIFLIGNGPSLSPGFLDLLQDRGEISWAMNRIHLIYPQTKWRPTRFWWTDHPQRQEHIDDVALHVNHYQEDCWLRWDVWEKLCGTTTPPEPPAHVHIWKPCNHHIGTWGKSEYSPTSWHWYFDKEEGKNPIAQWMPCKYGSGMSVLIQFAVYEGHNPIILSSCDGRFRGLLPGEPENNHFIQNYDYPGSIPRGWQSWRADRLNDTLFEMHTIAETECRKRGVTILDYSNPGYGVHQRVTLNELFGESTNCPVRPGGSSDRNVVAVGSP